MYVNEYGQVPMKFYLQSQMASPKSVVHWALNYSTKELSGKEVQGIKEISEVMEIFYILMNVVFIWIYIWSFLF